MTTQAVLKTENLQNEQDETFMRWEELEEYN